MVPGREFLEYLLEFLVRFEEYCYVIIYAVIYLRTLSHILFKKIVNAWSCPTFLEVGRIAKSCRMPVSCFGKILE